MASPQLEAGFVRISHELLRAIAQARLKPAPRAVLDCIIAYTYGWNRKEAPISLDQFAEWTGYSERTCRTAIQQLIAKNMIIFRNHQKPRIFGIRKDYDQWVRHPADMQEALCLPEHPANKVAGTSGKQGCRTLLRKKKEEIYREGDDRETWLTPFDKLWREAFGGPLPYGTAARYLHPLVKEHGATKTLLHFREWLSQQDPQYASLARFQSTFGSWAPDKVQQRQQGKKRPDRLADLVKANIESSKAI